MLILVNKEEFETIIRDLNEKKIETRFKPEILERKNHKDFIFLKMVSEDGLNTLQGISSCEVYETKKGNIGSVNTLWVSPEFRGNKYGEILVNHLMRFTKEKYPMYSFMTTSNKEALKSFLNSGFTSDNLEKASIRLIKAEE